MMIIGRIIKFGKYTLARSRDTVIINETHHPAEILEIRYQTEDFYCVRIKNFNQSLLITKKDLVSLKQSAKNIRTWNSWKHLNFAGCRNTYQLDGKTYTSTKSRHLILQEAGFREYTSAADCYITSEEICRGTAPRKIVQEFLSDTEFEEAVYFNYDFKYLAVFIK